jgi:hypothetical protein
MHSYILFKFKHQETRDLVSTQTATLAQLQPIAAMIESEYCIKIAVATNELDEKASEEKTSQIGAVLQIITYCKIELSDLFCDAL